MPSWELFEEQPAEYRDQVLPPGVTARVVVEQASNFGWERYVGRTGHMITMRTFGASAPLKELQSKFGFAPDKIVAAAGPSSRAPHSETRTARPWDTNRRYGCSSV